MDRVFIEYASQKFDQKADFQKRTAWIGFRIGNDYFKGAKDALLNEMLLSGTNLVRSGLENLGDLFYIYCTQEKTDKYVKAYVESMSKFTRAMVMARLKGFDATAQGRLLRQANKWTDANIEQRLKATGPAILTVYDMMSYFSHPNPGAVTYLENPKLLTAQINLVKQCNCMAAINLMGLAINHGNIKQVTYSELNRIATNLGFPLMQKP